MAKRVERQELIDLDGLRQGIAEVKSDYTSFASEVAKLNATMRRSAQSLQADLSKLLQMNNSGASLAQMQEYAQRATALGERLKDLKAAQDGLAKTEQQHTQALQSLFQKQEQLLSQYSQMQGNTAKEIQLRKQLATELTNVQGEYDRLDKVIKINSASTKEITGTYNRLDKELADARKELKGLEGAFDKSTGKLNLFNQRAVELVQTISKSENALKAMDKGMGSFGRSADSYKDALASGDITGAISSLGLWGVALATVGTAVIGFGKDVLDITAKFEKFNAILATSLGSAKAGEEAFKMIQDFAATTNFSVEQLTESYIKMANRGLRPGKEALTAIADVANTTGKPFDMLVEAINDINNTERWNNIGIKAKTNGDKVSLTFRGVTKTVERTEAGVLSAVEAFGKLPGVVGMTATISNTLEGQLSNLSDNFDNLKAEIGGDLQDGFKNLIGLASWLIQVFISLWKGTLPIRQAFGLVVDVLIMAGKEVWGLIKTSMALDERLGGSFGIIKMFGQVVLFSFRLVASAAIIALTGIQGLVGGLNVLMNTGKEVANFFGAKFKIDPNATFEKVAQRMTESANKLRNVWNGMPNAPKVNGPTVDTTVTPPPKEKTEEELKKERQQQLALDKAQFEERKALLAAQYEDGLIDQREYLAKKLALTKEEIAREMKLIVGSGKEQQAERIKLNRQRIDAEREYKRELLKMNIGNNKVSTDKQLSALDASYEAGPQTLAAEADYINKRLKIQQDGILREQELLRKAGREKTDEYKKTEEELEKIAADYLKRRRKIQEEGFKKAVEAVSAEINSDRSGLESQLITRLAALQQAYSNEETAIKAQMAKRIISEEQGEERLASLKIKLLQDIADATKANNDLILGMAKTRLDNLSDRLRAEGATELEIIKALEKERQDIEKERLEAAKKNADQQVNINEAMNQEMQKSNDRTAQKRAQLEEKAFEVTNAAVNSYFDITSSFREQDLQSLEKQKQQELNLAGDNSAKKEEIEKKYADKQRAIRRQQAQADKAQALFNIVLNTAMGVSKAFSTPYLIPYIVALGAIQAGVVAAKPIPEFFKGTADAPEGPAWVGERGYELIESKKGGKPHYRLAAERQVAYLNAHDRVYTHEESKRMLQTNREIAQEVRTAPGGGLYSPPVVVHNGLTKADLLEAFEAQTVQQTVLDDGEMKHYLKKHQQHTQWMNSRRSLPRTKH